MLRVRRNANLFLQNEREISAGLVEKLLKLERPVAERFYASIASTSTCSFVRTPVATAPITELNGWERQLNRRISWVGKADRGWRP